MNKKLRALLAAKQVNVDAMQALSDKYPEGVMSEDDDKEFLALRSKVESQNTAIEKEKFLSEQASTLGASDVEAEVDGGSGQVIAGTDRATLDPMAGFTNFGEFAACVQSARLNGVVDDRLRIDAAAPAGATLTNEAIGIDGGFLVPGSVSEEIFRLMLEEDSFIPLTSNQEVEGNSMTYRNSGEVTPWGSTGIQAGWVEEGALITPSKINPKSDEIKLHKIGALAPVTNEMMEDFSALSSYLIDEASAAMRYVANDAIINGDGVGKPLGIINSGALVTQAKVGSQAADTINAANVAAMFARWHARTSGQVALISHDAYSQILLMTIGDQPIWTPPVSGFKDAPDGFLLGRPIIKTDHLQTLGDLNDFLFVDFGFYRTLNKVGGGMRTDVSLHLYFDADASAFRFIFRLGGQSKMSGVIDPPNSAITRSPFVTLASRA